MIIPNSYEVEKAHSTTIFELIFYSNQSHNPISEINHRSVGWMEKFLITPAEYQDWFCHNFPEIIYMIQNLTPELASKYSHVTMANKFGLFEETICGYQN
jgi:hypothetical protein